VFLGATIGKGVRDLDRLQWRLLNEIASIVEDDAGHRVSSIAGLEPKLYRV